MDFETRAIHVGQEPDPATGAIITPIYQTSTYVQEAVGEHKGYDYSRVTNPTRTALQLALASLENAAHGIAFSSGIGATTTLMHLVDPGQRVVLIADVYGGVYRMTSQVYEPKGYRFTYVPAEEFDDNLASYLDDDVALVWVETPSNPLLNIVDIRRAADAAHAVGAKLVVDNTFATPYLQLPLDLGADAVLHSTTKYIGGHSDTIGGFVATNDDALGEQLYFLQKSLGAVPGPFDSWLVLRGLKTLALRMRQHCENARRIADFLDAHEAVERVLLPRPRRPIPSTTSPAARCATSAAWSRSSPSPRRRRSRCRRTKLFQLAESLGGVESLIEHPARMTHASTAGEPFAPPSNLVRLPSGSSPATTCSPTSKPRSSGERPRPARNLAPASGGTSDHGSSPKRASARGSRRSACISAVCRHSSAELRRAVQLADLVRGAPPRRWSRMMILCAPAFCERDARRAECSSVQRPPERVGARSRSGRAADLGLERAADSRRA